MNDNLYTIPEEISDVTMGRPHVVILGAGASLAAFPNGDRNGRSLPLMNNFVEVIGLEPILTRNKVRYLPGDNFEDLYSTIYDDPDRQHVAREIETVVEEYFSHLVLPDTPTIYDHLVLSLREKDVIATFNWDPFIYNACYRNHKVAKLPKIAYLHGSVAIGYCAEHRRKGVRGSPCSVCKRPFTPTRLLYPVANKDYNSDPFIRAEWSTLEGFLRGGFLLTIFGYGAPQSDVEAIRLMQTAWGKPEKRELEQIQIIDIKSEDELSANWASFIHTHHYEVHNNFYDSWIAKHPRRTCEAAWQQFLEAKFVDENPFPAKANFPDLHEWFKQLTDVENK